MLVNKQMIPEAETHVQFISYTGRYPNLCSGNLTLEIDGKTVVFENCDKFWSTAGQITEKYGDWIIDVEDIPCQFRKYAAEIDQVFNDNVERPHCGGCR